MRSLFILTSLCILMFSFPAFGQIETEEGRVFWRGVVDDRIHLVISGTDVEIRTLSGRDTTDISYSFTMPLPRADVTVRVVKIEGRGTAAVIQQPSDENGYQAIVEVVDRASGARDYQLEIIWQ
jgi:hypothetical protein